MNIFKLLNICFSFPFSTNTINTKYITNAGMPNVAAICKYSL